MRRAKKGTKLAALQDAWLRGDHDEALKIAAQFPRLGDHRDDIERGWAAVLSPGLYVGMGYDPAVLRRRALDALRERYHLPPYEDDDDAAAGAS